ncbi:MAG: SPOR domain-containing protein [Deltaproteobacteria bacterium]|nr:SPOR domain-containing protein [Deltaproteobacteria bacterium]
MKNKEPKDVDLEQELEALYRKVASADLPGDSSYPLQQLKTETAAPEEPGLPEQTNDCPIPRKEGSARRFLLMAIGMFFFLSLLCLVAIFFWPTIYNYESLNLGEKVYPIMINKLTGETPLNPPVSEAIKNPVSGNLNNPSAIIPPETSKIKAQAEESTAAPAPLKTRDKAKYVIQIKAFPEKREKDAYAFMEDVKKRMPDIQMKTTHIAGHGVWYRIWVGNFTSMKEASNNMKKLKLSESYPDSFIRMQSEE